MSGFLLFRAEDRKWVAKPGLDRSYTRDMMKAQVYPSREAAEAERCGNETIVPVSELR